jgi:hypothetical protein
MTKKRVNLTWDDETEAAVASLQVRWGASRSELARRGIRALSMLPETQRRAEVAEARIAQYEAVCADERAEIQRLIREVGGLERQLRMRSRDHIPGSV